MLQNVYDSLPVNSKSLPLAFLQSRELQPEDNFLACVSSPGCLVLCISHPFKYDTSLTTTPKEETVPPTLCCPFCVACAGYLFAESLHQHSLLP